MAKKISLAPERGSPSRSTSETSNAAGKSPRNRPLETAAGQETRAPQTAKISLARRTGEGRGEGRPSSLLDTRVAYCGDNLEQLAKLPDACVDLIYIDPPFNSNRNYKLASPARTWGDTKEKRACNSALRNCIDRQLLLPLRLARQPLRQGHARPDFRGQVTCVE